MTTETTTTKRRISAKQAAAQLLLDLMSGTVIWGITDERSNIYHLIGDDEAILEALDQSSAGEKRLNAVRGEMGALLEPFFNKLVEESGADGTYSSELDELMDLHGEMTKPKKASA